MNPEVRDKWVAALRSGEYKQGVGALALRAQPEDDFGYCCLGVLCDLAVADGVSVNVSYFSEGRKRVYDDTGSFLPPRVAAWAGLEEKDPELVNQVSGERFQASYWNDSGKATFPEIADMIESTFA